MILQICRWVTGGLSVTASIIAIVSAVEGPLKVIGETEIHATAWVLLAAVSVSVLGALLVQPLIECWWIAPRRARINRFREMLPRVLLVKTPLDQGVTLTEAQKRQYAVYRADLRASLRKLDIDIDGAIAEISIFTDMLERGALREAQKAFPVLPGTAHVKAVPCRADAQTGARQ